MQNSLKRLHNYANANSSEFGFSIDVGGLYRKMFNLVYPAANCLAVCVFFFFGGFSLIK